MQSKVSISIPKATLSELPTVSFPGEIIVIDTVEAVPQAVEYLRNHKIVGFDTETRPTFHKGRTNKVALIQISTDDRCYLFRINKTGLTEDLRSLIEDTNVTKIGLSLKDDFFVLHRISEFAPEGFIDLQEFVRPYGIIDSSLQRIYGIVFSERISKGQRLSNWEGTELTMPQQQYAAIDAWSCLRLYRELSSGKFIPEQSCYIVPQTVE
ncbi:MAG: 3'-5' exonuclease domain-containing protein 2 [Paramuribaculum sp.]|nr:3'-5' exonuclease domain-containing protein 2 [Paramuribaculum sp.]